MTTPTVRAKNIAKMNATAAKLDMIFEQREKLAAKYGIGIVKLLLENNFEATQNGYDAYIAEQKNIALHKKSWGF